MTWGMEWGGLWGGEVDSLDFDALFKSKLWKQQDYATQFRLLVEFLAAGYASVDGAIAAELQRVGIDAAYGDELDDWGLRIGPTPRNGVGDDLYRRMIKVSARKAWGEGDVSTIYDIVEIFSASAKATLVEGFPASWVIWLHNLTVEEQKQVGALLNGVPGLAIGAVAVVVDPLGVFQWSGPNTPTVTRHWAGPSSPASEHAGLAGVVII